jgi:hypothetical protein
MSTAPLSLNLIAPPGGWGLQKPPPGVGIDRTHPLGKSLWAYWAFNSGAGKTLADAGGFARHALIVGPQWVSTDRGPALDFNGTAGYAELPIGGPGLGDITISAWFNARSAGGAGTGRIIEVNGNTILYVTSTMINFTSDGNNTILSAAPASAMLGLRHHVVVRRNAAGTAWLYCDGRLIGTGSSGTPTASGTKLNIGDKATHGTRVFDGQLDAVALWTEMIPAAAALTTLYREPYCMFGRGGAWFPAAVPMYSGSLAAVAKRLTAVLAGTFTPPVYSGSLAAVGKRATAALAGGFTALTYSVVRIGDAVEVTVLNAWEGTLWYHWYLDGQWMGRTDEPLRVFQVPAGEQLRLEAIPTDQADFDPIQNAPTGFPARQTVWWTRSIDADSAACRVQQREGDGDWQTIAEVPQTAGQWDFSIITDRLKDLTQYTWRVVPLDAAGNEGQTQIVGPETLVRYPDAPRFAAQFNPETRTVQFSAA